MNALREKKKKGQEVQQEKKYLSKAQQGKHSQKWHSIFSKTPGRDALAIAQILVLSYQRYHTFLTANQKVQSHDSSELC